MDKFGLMRCTEPDGGIQRLWIHGGEIAITFCKTHGVKPFAIKSMTIAGWPFTLK